MNCVFRSWVLEWEMVLEAFKELKENTGVLQEKKINKIWGEYAYVLYFSGEDARIDDAEINEDYNVRLVSEKPCDDFVDMGTGVYWAKENTKKNQFRSCFTWKEAMEIK